MSAVGIKIKICLISCYRSPTAVVENSYVGWEQRSTALTDMDDLKVGLLFVFDNFFTYESQAQPLGDAPPETGN